MALSKALFEMSRRYLTHEEVESAINRGKQVEAFLGSFQKDENCIRWLSVSGNGLRYSVSVWEVQIATYIA